MNKSVDFHVRGDDADMSKIKALVEGLASYMNDRTLQLTEKKLVTVTTERSDIARILNQVASGMKSDNVVMAISQNVTKRGRKKKSDTQAKIIETVEADHPAHAPIEDDFPYGLP